MNQMLLERRREMIKTRNLGSSLAETVNVLSHKYGVSEQAIYKDWRNRKAWMPLFLEIDDPQQFFYDILSQHREIYRLASLEYLQADNSSAKVGCLRLLRDLNMDLVELVNLHDVTQRLDSLEAHS